MGCIWFSAERGSTVRVWVYHSGTHRIVVSKLLDRRERRGSPFNPRLSSVGCVVTVNGGRGVLVDVPADGNAWSDAWWWIIILINFVNPVKLLLPLLILWSFARTTSDHEGPPFALFVDQKVDRYIVSV